MGQLRLAAGHRAFRVIPSDFTRDALPGGVDVRRAFGHCGASEEQREFGRADPDHREGIWMLKRELTRCRGFLLTVDLSPSALETWFSSPALAYPVSQCPVAEAGYLGKGNAGVQQAIGGFPNTALWASIVTTLAAADLARG